MFRSIVLLLAVAGYCFAAVTPAFADGEKPVDPRKIQATNRADAGPDYAFQGEFKGTVYAAQLEIEPVGLQVIALGESKYKAVQYCGGLPGDGWNRQDKIEMVGSRDREVLKLGVEGSKYSVTIQNDVAVLLNSKWQEVGRLYRIERRSPTLGKSAPKDSIVLFDGTNADRFVEGKMSEDNLLTEGNMMKDPVGDFQMHVEFQTPFMPFALGQRRGNSGVYIQQRYEVQVLDSFGLAGEHNECGGIYRTKVPDVNMCFPPLTWQTYDIFFKSARFDEEGNKKENARITVYHNGVAIHKDYELKNKTGAGRPEEPFPRPIWFQHHGDPVRFRNVWLKPANIAFDRPVSMNPIPSEASDFISELSQASVLSMGPALPPTSYANRIYMAGYKW